MLGMEKMTKKGNLPLENFRLPNFDALIIDSSYITKIGVKNDRCAKIYRFYFSSFGVQGSPLEGHFRDFQHFISF